MNPFDPQQHELIARRTFLGRASLGLGSMALTGLLQPKLWAATASDGGAHGPVDPLHFAPKAKRVIFLCMAGGPSQFELFDDKPKLAAMHGQPIPTSFTAGQPIAQLQHQAQLLCFGPQAKFARHGTSGQLISNRLPHHAKIADDICIIRSMQTEQINHDPAHTFM
ncbi:MAG: DUF1501 domain-containing protein, partial [Pirellulales bacterium]